MKLSIQRYVSVNHWALLLLWTFYGPREMVACWRGSSSARVWPQCYLECRSFMSNVVVMAGEESQGFLKILRDIKWSWRWFLFSHSFLSVVDFIDSCSPFFIFVFFLVYLLCKFLLLIYKKKNEHVWGCGYLQVFINACVPTYYTIYQILEAKEKVGLDAVCWIYYVLVIGFMQWT